MSKYKLSYKITIVDDVWLDDPLNHTESPSIKTLQADIKAVQLEDYEEESEINVGEVMFHIIKCGGDMEEDADAHSQELHDVVSAITAGGFMKERFQPDLVGTDTSFIYVSSIVIEPEHRGRQLALRTLFHIANHYGLGCGTMVLMPFPIGATDKKQIATGKKRLADYYSRLGFRKLPRTRYYALNLDYTPPKYEDLFCDEELEVGNKYMEGLEKQPDVSDVVATLEETN